MPQITLPKIFPQKSAQPKLEQEPSAVGEADSEDEALADASGGPNSARPMMAVTSWAIKKGPWLFRV